MRDVDDEINESFPNIFSKKKKKKTNSLLSKKRNEKKRIFV